MARYALRRLAMAFLVIVGVSVVSFSIIYLTPGDPAELLLGATSDSKDIERLREEMGLNKPLWAQYLSFLQGAVRGLGKSRWTNRTVGSMIAERLPTTLVLTALSILLVTAVAIPAGVVAAVRRHTAVDYTLMILAMIGNSIPGFWLGLLLMWFFAGYLHLLPVSGSVGINAGIWQYLRYFIMPTLSLAFWMAALLARLTRSMVLEVLGEDYIRTARAKGLAERVVIYRHALKNTILPVITVIGLYLGTLIGGAVVSETIFALPGVGRMVVQAILVKDFAVVQGVLLVTASLLVIVNLLVDLSYAYFDPRIRYG